MKLPTDKYLFRHASDYRSYDSLLLQKHERLHAMHAGLLATANDVARPIYLYDIPDWADDIYLDDARDVPDWKQTTFVSGPATPPAAAKRAKLRAKRKKRS
jgi:hypothetical protein